MTLNEFYLMLSHLRMFVARSFSEGKTSDSPPLPATALPGKLGPSSSVMSKSQIFPFSVFSGISQYHHGYDLLKLQEITTAGVLLSLLLLLRQRPDHI